MKKKKERWILKKLWMKFEGAREREGEKERERERERERREIEREKRETETEQRIESMKMDRLTEM